MNKEDALFLQEILARTHEEYEKLIERKRKEREQLTGCPQ